MPAVGLTAFRHLRGVVSGSHRRTIGVQALVRDRDGAVLVVRTTYPPRRWNLPGGRVDGGETPDQAAIREAHEETGLDLRVERLVAVDVRLRTAVVLVFDCTVVGGTLRPAPGEIAAVRWVAESELPRLSPWLRETIRSRSLAGGPIYLR